MLRTKGAIATAGAVQAGLVVVLGDASGLHPSGWAVVAACVLALDAAVLAGVRETAAEGLGPGDLVTLARAVLACVVAALTVESLLLHRSVVGVLVPLAAVALAMDALDGWVARHTATTSRFGQRFDGEVDAFLILVLSAYVAPRVGAWVLFAGLVRYVFGAAGWARAWLRRQLPYRYWRKVVTATVGIALTAAAAPFVPTAAALVLLVVALGLLAESFARDVWWLWRHRTEGVHAGLAASELAAASVELV